MRSCMSASLSGDSPEAELPSSIGCSAPRRALARIRVCASLSAMATSQVEKRAAPANWSSLANAAR